MQSRSEIVANLRRSLTAHEWGGDRPCIPLGHAYADASLRGGLRRDALHEVYAENISHAAAASGFTAGIARRFGGVAFLFWIGAEVAAQEFAGPNANGLFDLGFDPDRFVLLRLARGDDVLRAAGDVLACRHIGALVIEIAGELKALDLTASRRLALAAARQNVSVILLRLGAQPEASAAETRWLIRAAPSPPEDWPFPRFDAQLLRNRHGDLGHWQMEWDCDHGFFREPGKENGTADHGDIAAAFAG
jgi:protein ImuA